VSDGRDIYDWIDTLEGDGMKRHCPRCHDSDVKYGIHSKRIVGCELSVRCNACGWIDSGDNSGADAERMARECYGATL